MFSGPHRCLWSSGFPSNLDDTTRTRKLDAQRLGVVSSTSCGAERCAWYQTARQDPSSLRWANPGRSTHHVLCLHAPLQLLPEVLGAEFHGSSPAGATAQRGQNPSSDSAHTTSTLTGTTSGEASTSALTEASVNAALPPSHKPRFPTVLGFRAYRQSANQNLHKDGIGPSRG